MESQRVAPDGQALAAGLSAGLERLLGLLRWPASAGGLSLTAATTLATLERSGPCRLTWLAGAEGVTQPGMTQLISRLEGAGLVARSTDPADRRVVRVAVTDDGRALLARRRSARAERLAAMLDLLSPPERAALAAALPAVDALAAVQAGSPRTSSQEPATQAGVRPGPWTRGPRQG